MARKSKVERFKASRLTIPRHFASIFMAQSRVAISKDGWPKGEAPTVHGRISWRFDSSPAPTSHGAMEALLARRSRSVSSAPSAAQTAAAACTSPADQPEVRRLVALADARHTIGGAGLGARGGRTRPPNSSAEVVSRFSCGRIGSSGDSHVVAAMAVAGRSRM